MLRVLCYYKQRSKWQEQLCNLSFGSEKDYNKSLRATVTEIQIFESCYKVE